MIAGTSNIRREQAVNISSRVSDLSNSYSGSAHALYLRHAFDKASFQVSFVTLGMHCKGAIVVQHR